MCTRRQKFRSTTSSPDGPVVRLRVLPGVETDFAEAVRGESVTKFLTRNEWASNRTAPGWQFSNRLPTICVMDGAPVPQRAWRKTRIREGSHVEFWSRPMGGNGSGSKQIIGLVALVALTAIAGPIGGYVAGGLGLPAFFGTIIAGGIVIGGEPLIDVFPICPILEGG